MSCSDWIQTFGHKMRGIGTQRALNSKLILIYCGAETAAPVVFAYEAVGVAACSYGGSAKISLAVRNTKGTKVMEVEVDG